MPPAPIWASSRYRPFSSVPTSVVNFPAGAGALATSILPPVTMVHASYHTDPACPRSWGIEPALRRLEVEFGEEVQITYVMGGLAREFGDFVRGELADGSDLPRMPPRR